jgi:hypothetical protein
VKDALPTQRLHDWELHARSASALQMGRNVTSEGWGFLQDRWMALDRRKHSTHFFALFQKPRRSGSAFLVEFF